MSRFDDITRIKFGFATIFNLQLTRNNCNVSKEQSVNNEITLEHFLEMVKQKFYSLKINDLEKSVYAIFKCIEKIMNSPVWEKRNIDYFSGIKLINQIIFTLLGEGQRPYNTHYVNNAEGLYVEVYTLVINGKNYYFAYQNSVKLNEVSEEYISYLEEKCDYIDGYNLVRRSK